MNLIPPTSYRRIPFQYLYQYQDPRQPFQLPAGISSTFAPQFQQASNVFRMFDRNSSGRISKREFKLAMRQLGYHVDRHQLSSLFRMIDVNNSGSIDEREFVEFFVYTQHYHQQGFGLQYFIGAPMLATAPLARPGLGERAKEMVVDVLDVVSEKATDIKLRMAENNVNSYHAQPMSGLYLIPPSNYDRIFYQYPSQFQDPRQPFQAPIGLSNTFSPLVQHASNIFRLYDRNSSGRLSKREFKLAMHHLGYHVERRQLSTIFRMIDRNNSGSIDEREFVEFFIYSQHYHQQGFGPQYFFGGQAPQISNSVPLQSTFTNINIPQPLQQPSISVPRVTNIIGAQPVQPAIIQPNFTSIGQPTLVQSAQPAIIQPNINVQNISTPLYLVPPTSYSRLSFNYPTVFQDPRQPFQLPLGISPSFSQQFLQASNIFRTFDRNFSGRISKREFKNAMIHLGYNLDRRQLSNLFHMIDVNNSGSIDEREFVEFFVYSQHYHQQGFGLQYFTGLNTGYTARPTGVKEKMIDAIDVVVDKANDIKYRLAEIR